MTHYVIATVIGIALSLIALALYRVLFDYLWLRRQYRREQIRKQYVDQLMQMLDPENLRNKP